MKGHRHAFYLPTDEDGDGRLDHLTVWAPCGFNAKEMNALGSVQEMRQRGGRDPLRLVFESYGSEHEFRESVPIFRKSTRWRSVTPFALNRHVKWRGPKENRHQVDGPEDQVRKEIERRESISASVKSAEIEDPRQPRSSSRGHEFRPLEFYRWRRNGSQGSGGAYNFTITFDEAVGGPIALGYACHFGLGLFVPA